MDLLLLTLLVFGIIANYPDNAAPLNNLAFITHRFNANSYLHIGPLIGFLIEFCPS